jgi:ribonuclease D
VIVVALDKEQQCSDWDARPLSKRQLRYAAIDAVALVEIAEAMALKRTTGSREMMRGPLAMTDLGTL